MDLDPAVLLPAVLFTVVAVYLASSLLRRKPDRTASCSAGTNKPKVGHGDDVAPSRPPGEPLLSAGPEPAEKKRDSPELKVKVAPEPAPEPVTVPEPVKLPEPVIKQAPSQVPFPEPLEVSVPVTEPAVEPEPAKEPEPAVEPEPAKEPEPAVEPEPAKEPEPAVEPEPAKEPEPAVEPEPAKEPEPVKQNLGKLSPELTAAQKRVLETLKVVESVPEPEPVTVTKTLVDSSVVPEPESSASPEPVKVSDPEPKPEVVQQPETEPEFEKVDESGPEPAAENVSEPKGLVPEEPEPEDNSLNDVDAAAAQIESSKLEALMEEQRVELTSDLTCL